MGKRGREEAKMLDGETKGFTLSQAECGTPGSEKLPSCGEVRRRCGRRGVRRRALSARRRGEEGDDLALDLGELPLPGEQLDAPAYRGDRKSVV